MKRRYSPQMKLRRPNLPQPTSPNRVSSAKPKSPLSHWLASPSKAMTALFVMSLTVVLLLVALGVTSSDKGLSKEDLKSAFESLPKTLLEIDPKDLGDTKFIKNSQGIAFGSGKPFQLIDVETATSSNFERISFDKFIASASSTSKQFLADITKLIEEDDKDVKVTDASIVNLPKIGDISVAVSLMVKDENVQFRYDMIFFRRDNIRNFVMVISLASEKPEVPVEKAASLLDTKIQEFLKTRDAK
jgi:hypothetical protein